MSVALSDGTRSRTRESSAAEMWKLSSPGSWAPRPPLLSCGLGPSRWPVQLGTDSCVSAPVLGPSPAFPSLSGGPWPSSHDPLEQPLSSSPGGGRMCSGGPLPWESPTVSPCGMGTGLPSEIPSPPLTPSWPPHRSFAACATFKSVCQQNGKPLHVWDPKVVLQNSHNYSHLLSPQRWKVLCCGWIEREGSGWAGGGSEIWLPVVALSDRFAFLEPQFPDL